MIVTGHGTSDSDFASGLRFRPPGVLTMTVGGKQVPGARPGVQFEVTVGDSVVWSEKQLSRSGARKSRPPEGWAPRY